MKHEVIAILIILKTLGTVGVTVGCGAFIVAFLAGPVVGAGFPTATFVAGAFSAVFAPWLYRKIPVE